MELNGKIWLAKSDEKVFLEPKMANRHGFIAGASGTGKTITLKVLAESFSQLGVPVFLADIKGDLAGMCKAGVHSESMEKRINKLGIEDWRYRVFPTRFWDIYGEYGHPVRTTVSEMGPMLLSRLMDLSDVQSDVLNLVFKIADDKGLLLIDIKDLKAMLRYVGENRAEFSAEYGNMSAQSLGAIQRSLITLEDEGGAEFFGEPAIDIRDWMQRDEQGRGYINVLHSVKLVQNPTLYATFMLFLMSELFEKLPERGDAEKPEMVFFFDEAHLLFSDAPKVLVQKIEQVVKLIRSKGVGEALVSCLDENGVPGIVQRAFILPPQSRMGTITDEERRAVIDASDMKHKYDKAIDNFSAYEYFEQQNGEPEKEEERAAKQAEREEKKAARNAKKPTAAAKTVKKKKSAASKAMTRVTNSAMSTIGRELGRSIIRGIFGSIK